MASSVLGSLYDVLPLNAWDSVSLTESNYYSVRLFGSANVGNLNLSNLQVPGMLVHDRTAVVQRWYARTNLPKRGPARDAFNLFAEQAYVTMILGDKPQSVMNLRDLIARRPTYEGDSDSESTKQRFDSVPIVVPIRQNVSASLDRFSQSVHDRMLGAFRECEIGSAHVWVHLEGFCLPFESSPNSDLATKVIDHVLMLTEEQRSTEQRVIDYLLGVAMGTTDETAKAQCFALADGIMEGRAR